MLRSQWQLKFLTASGGLTPNPSLRNTACNTGAFWATAQEPRRNKDVSMGKDAAKEASFGSLPHLSNASTSELYGANLLIS